MLELAIRKRRYSSKIFLIALLALCSVLFIQSAIVFAQASILQPYIGMDGVNNPTLTIGMDTVDDSSRMIDRSGHSGYLNPSSPGFQLASIIPMIFIAMAILLIFNMIETGKPNIKVLILIGILIYLTIAFMPTIQSIITGLLGV